jgi:hypothetical protein
MSQRGIGGLSTMGVEDGYQQAKRLAERIGAEVK